MSIAVRPICRARTADGSRRTIAKIAHPTTGATTTVASVPRRASSSCSPVNAMLEINSETVKPIPAQAPAPTSNGLLSGDRGPCNTGRDASQEPPNTPIGLPTM
jgi:hypothetical protein